MNIIKFCRSRRIGSYLAAASLAVFGFVSLSQYAGADLTARPGTVQDGQGSHGYMRLLAARATSAKQNMETSETAHSFRTTNLGSKRQQLPPDGAPNTLVPACQLTQSTGTGSCGSMTLPAACATTANCNTAVSGCTVGTSLQCATMASNCGTMSLRFCTTNTVAPACYTTTQDCIDRTLSPGCQTFAGQLCFKTTAGLGTCTPGGCVVYTSSDGGQCNTSSSFCQQATLSTGCLTSVIGPGCTNTGTYNALCITTLSTGDNCTSAGACLNTWAFNCLTVTTGGECKPITVTGQGQVACTTGGGGDLLAQSLGLSCGFKGLIGSVLCLMVAMIPLSLSSSSRSA